MKGLRFIVGALPAVLWIAPLHAQQSTGTIRGRVTDAASQQPLVGATVSIGTRRALSETDGRYVIAAVPAGTDSVRVRLIGYRSAAQQVSVAGGDTVTVDFALNAQAVSLSEVVVTGYGTQQAGNITGAVKQVTSAEFNTGRVVTPQALIQGKVAGVEVIDTSNMAGGGFSIRIRGATSVNASSDPLYVIDGLPVNSVLSAGRDPLNFLNPSDIESITVLKDASAAAIYGANAANGVVLITTKKSRQHGPEIEYTTSVSSSSVIRVPSVLDATQFKAAVAAQAPARSASLGNANTNWFDLIDRSSFGHQHDVVVSGVGQSSNYRFSVGYLNQDGIIRTSSTERLSLGVSYEQLLLNDNLDIKTNVRGARTTDHFQASDVLGNAVAMAPTQPVYDSTNATGYWDWPTTGASASNPVASLNRSVSQGSTWRSIGNVQGAYHLPFLRSLTANVNVGYDLTQANTQTFIPNDLAAQIRQGQGYLNLSNPNQSSLVSETYLNYTAPLSAIPGQIDITGGYSYSRAHSESPFFQATGLTSNLLGVNGYPGSTNPIIANTTVTDYKLISFFGRFNYNLNDRYLLAGSLRRDGSSRFGAGNQWGTFPSVSLAWRISQEPFLRNITALSDLKIRASWAKTGNQAFGDYLQYPTYTYSNTLAEYYFGGQFLPTIRPSAVDPNIHWESTKSYNVGVDYALFDQRVTGAIDWYTKNTSDLIFTVPVAAGTNFSNLVTTNVGTMRNRGIEFSVSAKVLQGSATGLGWTADFTVSHNGNELLSINPNKTVSQINVGGIGGGTGNTIQVLKPGFPINSFFVCQQFYQNGKPVDNTYVPLVQNAAGDSTVQGCTNDMRPFHSPWPTVELGHTSYLTFQNFDLSFTLRAQLGNYVYNNVAAANGSYQNITSGNVTPTNMDASVLTTNFTAPRFLSDYYVQKASFLRMDNITLGYAFQYGGRPWRAYATIQNAFTITGYDGVDPTAGLNGIDNNIYPRSRTFSGGLSVRF